MFDLTGKTALITGASGGIGKEITKTFLSQGANVVISGSNDDKLSEFINELNTDKDLDKVMGKVGKIVANLSDKESTNKLFSEAENIFGPIDILVNNAGITKDKISILMNDNDFESVINLNLVSCFRLSKAAIKSMLKRNYGRIINITSVIGFIGNIGQANYAASKAGIFGMSKSLAIEVATKGITINCVAPGFIQTNMTDKLKDDIKNSIMSNIPSQKFGTGKDVAACCVFLASKEAEYITGQTIHVDGGMFRA